MPSKLPTTPILLLDGGLGTTLEDQFNVKFDTQTPLWSAHLLVSSPETLLQAQTAFAKAGADVILTSTYQASYEGFRVTPRADGQAGKQGYDEQEALKFMQSAVHITRKALTAAGKTNGLVALSLGAYGATMRPSTEYSGKYDAEHQTKEQLSEFHTTRLRDILSDAEVRKEVDVLAFETLPLRVEVEAAREAAFTSAQELGNESKPFWISCVFPGEADDFTLPDGSSIDELIKTLVGKKDGQARPDGIGLNCTKLDKVPGVIERFEKALQGLVDAGELAADEKLTLLVYPDGTKGEVYDTVKKIWVLPEGSRQQSETWDQTLYGIVKETQDRGKWRSIMVGGCCKAAPEDIGKLRKQIDRTA